MTETEIEDYGTVLLLKTFAAFFFSIFIGYALQQGLSIKSKMRNETLKYQHRINYNTGDSEDVYIITSNSQYSFNVPKNSKTIKISPIASIKNIELIDNKMLK